MVASPVVRTTGSLVGRRSRSTLLRVRLRLGRSAAFTFGALTVVLGVLGVLVVQAPLVFATPLLFIPFLVGAWVLPMRWLVPLAAVLLVCRSVVAIRHDEHPVAVIGAVLALITLVVLGARARSRLGVPGSRGESILFDLRERLLAQDELPTLPAGWTADVVHRSAHGESFGGDFLVSRVSSAGTDAEIALVDVSGKGIDAGTRALLLSGAFGGLLGAVPSEHFLPAANQYLLRQGWEEGFATAVYVAFDTATGAFGVSSAGHPPAVHYHAGSGEWEVLEASGPALGVLADAAFEGHAGRLLPGDALLLYTDGLVEAPDRDLAVGIDRLLGMAERLVTGGFERGASTLLQDVPDTESDDRACVLIWRS